ncbi:sulfatase-like hydrolase/transferase, partial [Komagataeibacter europaeus]
DESQQAGIVQKLSDRALTGDTVSAVLLAFCRGEPVAVKHTITDPAITGRTTPDQPNIIVVIGESAVANRHSFEGYTKYNDTPYMSSLQKTGKICVIGHVHSAANVTHNAVPMLLSFFDADHLNNLYSEKNLIEMAQDQNYFTAWFGTQRGTSSYARPFGYLSEFSNFVIRPDINNSGNRISWQDESLLPVIEQTFSQGHERGLYVIHLTGSHFAYKDDVTEEDVNALPTLQLPTNLLFLNFVLDA